MKLVSTKEEQTGEKNQTQIVGYKWIPWAFSPPPPPPHRIARYFLSRMQNWLAFPCSKYKIRQIPTQHLGSHTKDIVTYASAFFWTWYTMSGNFPNSMN